MKYLRPFIKTILVTAWFTLISVCVALTNWRRGWRGVAKAAEWTRVWARGASRLAGIRVKVIGDPGQFKSGLIVSNHLGYLDIPAHASVFAIRFAPKAEMKYWPFLGQMTSLGRPVWIDRKSPTKAKKTEEIMVETMRNGISMLVYPEGTSTDGEHGLLPFKSTPFAAAAELSLPIQPTLLFYRGFPDDGKPLAWFGSQSLLPHIWRTLGRKRVEVDVHILPVITPYSGENRKELALRVHEIMEKEYWRIKHHAHG